ncbi:TPA: hypothetical protein JA361_11045 [Legionella pneumophila]|nr:hypothetical protein [Legionella pneumophila]HAT8183647.1 hypothetical protein [Legionella pneumophila]
MNKISIQKNTLLFVHISTHFKEMMRVARLMKQDGNFRPYIFFYSGYEGVKRDIEQCQSEGIQYITYFDSDVFQPKHGFKHRVIRWTLKLIFKILEIIIYLLKPISWCFNGLSYIYRKLASIQKNKLYLKNNKWFIILLVPFYYLLKSIALICNGIFHFYRKFSKNRKSKLSFKNENRLASLLIVLYKLTWNKLPFFLPTISRAAYRYSRYIDGILKQYEIKLLVYPEHNLFYFTQLTSYIGKKYNIASIIVPFTIANTKEWAEAFYNEPACSLSKIYNKLMSIAFPHWVLCYKNKQIILHADLILLHEMLGATPKNPWLLNSGMINFLAIESNAMKEYYIAAGLEENYLRSTGALYNDELYLKLQNADLYRLKLYQSLDMQPNKPMILCALPPNQCESRLDVIEFIGYSDLVRYVLGELEQYANEYNIVINLHPRINPSTVEFISDYPIKVFYGDVAEIIPLSSIYVATCSATIRMAITCGIPVINYDLYQYRYDDYDNLKGVITLFSRIEFSNTLKKLVKESNFYEEIQAAQLKDSTKWGLLDGKSGENLLSEINLLFT